MKIETLTSKTDNKNWHLVASCASNNELIFCILVTGIKSCEVRKWIKALTLDEATDRTRAGKIYTIELKNIGNCRNTLSTVQNGKKGIWHYAKGTNAETVEIPWNNAHQFPASGKNVASVTKRIICYNMHIPCQ